MYAKLLAIFLCGIASAQNQATEGINTQNIFTSSPPTTLEPFPIVNINSSCFIAKMGMRVRVKENCFTLQNGNYTVECLNSTVSVTFNLPASVTLGLEFATRGKEYFLNSSILEYKNKTYKSSDKETYFKTNFNNYYQCFNQPRIQMTNEKEKAYLEFKQLKLEIFNSNNSRQFSKTANKCKEDKTTSNIVPIVVGAVLTGMIVIVLIAYLIGRRNNKSGYESV